jgi:hypothetical protein
MSTGLHADQIIGAWELEEWRIGYGDGRAPTHPFGTKASGLLLYTADGFMSAGISRPVRPSLGGGSARHVDAATKCAAFDGYFHYQGRYAIEGSRVVHTVMQALNPDFVGTRQVREARLTGGVLELSAEDVLPGTSITRHHQLRWRRP